MTEDSASRARLTALLRVDEAVRVDPAAAIEVLVDEIRAMTGASCAMVTVLDEADGSVHQSVLASSGTEPSGRDLPPGLCGLLTLPVASAEGTAVVATVCVLHSEPLELGVEELAVLRLLARVATGPLREQLARGRSEDSALRARTTTREVLAGVRRAQDELGNGLGVAIGRLRLAADAEQAGVEEHVAAAVARLDSLSAASAAVLRDIHDAALDSAALGPVDLWAARSRLAPAPAPPSPDPSGAGSGPSWVRADAASLEAVLAALGPHLGEDAGPADGFVVLPLRDAAPLTTEVLLDLDASGGRLVQAAGRPALAWPTTGPALAP